MWDNFEMVVQPTKGAATHMLRTISCDFFGGRVPTGSQRKTRKFIINYECLALV